MVQELAGTLIKNMRSKFALIADDNFAQEIIADEVNKYVARGGSICKDDILALEDRIRGQLSGDDAPRNTLAAQKRAVADKDEWAKIYNYQIQEGRTIAKEAERKRLHDRNEMVTVLERQKVEQEMAKTAEKEHDMAYVRMEMADLKAWEQENEEKVRRKAAAVAKLNAERRAQLDDKQHRIQMAMERKAREEKETMTKMAHETK